MTHLARFGPSPFNVALFHEWLDTRSPEEHWELIEGVAAGSTERPRMSRSSTITDDEVEPGKLLPIHPGEFLREDFLVPLDMTPETLAKACGAAPDVIAAIVREEAPISGEIALRLARYFNMSPEFWMNVQARYEIENAEDEFEAEILKIRPRPQAAE
ncbi:MAG TPA: HigA family addiction module antitoxin [Beijerinckiaceae bacterium]|nr:HigA family addiction module antitoxin [Beijerinckiaceae bacterium]